MRLILVSLLLATPAAAQPVTQPETCEVTIARAPDEVRATIEQWLVGEHCTVPLELRIVPTEGGLYLLARDGRGRVRERIVPDAESAGVLVASWAADDGLGPQPAIAPPAPVPVESPWVAPHPGDHIPLAPPSASVPEHEPVDGGATVRRHTGWRWFGLSLLEGAGRGARATIDLSERGRWTFGTAVSASTGKTFNAAWNTGNGPYAPAYLEPFDARGVGYIARTFGDGLWTIRTSLGVGFVWTHVAYEQMTGFGWDAVNVQHSIGTWSPMAEGSVLIGRDLGDRWGIDFGLLASLYNQSFQPSTDVSIDRMSEWEFIMGLRHRL